MSEKILKALMQLFAIIAKGDELSKDARIVVSLFLEQQLNKARVEEYLKLFDLFLAEQPEKKKTSADGNRRTSVKDSVRVLRICTQINEELEQKQKIVVLIRILEFISASGRHTPQEIEFATTVASTFNVTDAEFANIKAFVYHSDTEVFNSSDLLIIDNKSEDTSNKRHLFSENLSGRLEILHVPSVDMFLVRQIGAVELYLNGQLMRHNQINVLTRGSSIRNQKISPIYYSDVVSSFINEKSDSKIIFSVKGIEYIFSNGYKGLQPLTFTEVSGKLMGIMGSSGSGKSTLLNVLNGIEKPTTGKVTINGIDIHRDKEKAEGIIGYVSQDDLLMEDLSVYQNLYYNAKLCFGGIGDEEISQRVDKLLEDIGLFEIRHLKVGNPLNKKISGGQRKRLNIGLELIREPSVLFVDEPTSGLSSRDSENIMDLLKELSLKGKLVFVVIHQPSSDIFKMFDTLLILDNGGYGIYIGNPVDGITYFKKIIHHVNSEESECITCGNVNPEQIFNIIESKVIDEYGNPTRERKISSKEWSELFAASDLSKKFPADNSSGIAPKNSFSIPSKITQFGVFITRDVLSKLSNAQYMAINFLEAPLLAFILAFMVRYFNASKHGSYFFRENENIPAYLFMSIIVALFMGLTVSAEEIIRDRKILKREEFLNLSRSSYLFSKVLILFTISAIQTICFVLIGNYILKIEGMTFVYWMALFTTSCFANMLGLNISATFNSAVTIYILIPILLIPQLLLSGVIVKFDKLNPVLASESVVPMAGESMASRWAFEAIAVEQFMNNKFEKNFYLFEKSMSKAEYKKTYWIPILREKIGACENELMSGVKSKEYVQNLELIRNELKKESLHFKSIKTTCIDSITPELFSQSVAASANDYLKNLFELNVKIFNKYNDQKDHMVSEMQSSPEKMKFFNELKSAYENESMNDLVKNDKILDHIVEKDGKLIQKMHPVFTDPEFSGALDFRAHFFAPRKQFMGNFYNTFPVNMVIIWLMTITLYVTLFFETFRKLIDYSARMAEFLSPGKKKKSMQ